jgi:iron(II)-dependent oxidoreductase
MSLPERIVNLRDSGEAVLVPQGRFYCGVTQLRIAEILADLRQPADPVFGTEQAPQLVFLHDYYIDRCPVTNGQYALFLKDTGRPAPLYWKNPRYSRPRQPVVGINYHDAVAYAAWAGKRLPTEEEWERAARGDDRRAWPWGDTFDRRCCNSKEWLVGMPTEVGIFPAGASPFGCLDMAGNVWELTSSEWEGFGKAIRGGSFRNPASFCRTTVRWGIDPDLRGSVWLGFRCVMDLAKARLVARAATPSP